MEENKNQKSIDGGLATEVFFWAQALAVSLVVLVLINLFFFRMTGVVGSSMYPTLEQSDRVLIRVIGYDEPKRGDIVVVNAPMYEQGPLVKRIIGVGGDVIDIDKNTGAVYINGEEQYEPYISELIRKRMLLTDTLSTETLRIFLMLRKPVNAPATAPKITLTVLLSAFVSLDIFIPSFKEKDISKQKITPIMSGNICVTADDMTSAKTSKNELYVSADAAFPDKEIIKV